MKVPFSHVSQGSSPGYLMPIPHVSALSTPGFADQLPIMLGSNTSLKHGHVLSPTSGIDTCGSRMAAFPNTHVLLIAVVSALGGFVYGVDSGTVLRRVHRVH